MNHLRNFALPIAVACTSLQPCLATPTDQINALWNDDNGFGVWVYPGSGACPEVRERLTTFTVFGPKFPARSARIQTASPAEMNVCMRMDGKTGQMSKCSSGQIQITYDASSNEYRGTVDLTLADGSIVRTAIRAQYCKRS
jgi:hypothetical protein